MRELLGQEGKVDLRMIGGIGVRKGEGRVGKMRGEWKYKRGEWRMYVGIGSRGDR